MNVQVKKQTSVTLTPCVQTLKDPMSVGAREVLKVMEETAQVNTAF